MTDSALTAAQRALSLRSGLFKYDAQSDHIGVVVARIREAEKPLRGIIERHKPVDTFDVYDKPMPEPQCSDCTRSWPCPDRLAAQAALDALVGDAS